MELYSLLSENATGLTCLKNDFFILSHIDIVLIEDQATIPPI